jgi:hypothetical protein
MATLISYALAVDFPTVQVDAALFAPPTVGNAYFASEFNRRVNGRRIAFVGYRQGPDSRGDPSWGDQVPQMPCPSQYLCNFDDARFKLVSTRIPKDNVKTAASYKEVNGSVLFDWRDMPNPPPSYGLSPDIIKKTFREKDGAATTKASHVCSYSCYFSDAVNVNFTRCLFKQNVPLINPKIPQEVQEYGFCNEPPPTTVQGELYPVDQVVYV